MFSHEIIRMYCNPAFLGFDLMYIGILFTFFNWYLCFATSFVLVFFHLQMSGLKPLVIAGYSFEGIKELFNQHSDTEEIRDFIKQMGIV